MKKYTGWSLLAATICLITLLPARDSLAGEQKRLVLTNGGVIQIKGPVEHTDGLVVFQMLDGTFGSLNESMVREVSTGPQRAAGRAVRPSPAEGRPSGPVLYTNEDLPENPPEPPQDPAGPETPLPPAEGALPADPGDRALALRQQLEAAALERNTAYRALVCAQHEIPLDRAECKASLLPKPDNPLPAETEKSLRARFLESERRLEELQTQLKALQ